MKALPLRRDPNLLVGIETSDDAGVYRLTDDIALVQTLDFFTPIVDDPFYFGQIAAANSLSDVYAMGGKPLTAMNIVCFPVGDMPGEVLTGILQGGLEKIHEAGAILVGGHSVDDKELKYGLSVTGTVHPDRILGNGGARPGDRIILTKPIGTGILATAVKGNLAGEEALKTLIHVTSMLNKKASEVASVYSPHACTDVTGFGLGGHLLEVARASGVEIALFHHEIPVIPEALEFGNMGLIPAGTYATRHFCEHRVDVKDGLAPLVLDLIFDPQTSGGLAFSVPGDQADPCLKALKDAGIEEAAVIGDVTGLCEKGRLSIQ
jgi:selenide,water dikinase